MQCMRMRKLYSVRFSTVGPIKPNHETNRAAKFKENQNKTFFIVFFHLIFIIFNPIPRYVQDNDCSVLEGLETTMLYKSPSCLQQLFMCLRVIIELFTVD